MSKFTVTKNPAPVDAAKRAQLMANPVFGRVFTDHMAMARWNTERGWHDLEIKPYGPLTLDPACSVLHYAQEIFEGLKAYRQENGSIALFRPQQNAARFGKSALRMEMPPLPEDLFLESITQLIHLDKNWVPDGSGSLYLRPFMFASEAFLGVRPSTEYLYLLIASPVGAYFSGGKDTVKIWVSEKTSRAAPGGTGAAKCGGNYAASLIAQAEAYKNGCDQVVFLDTTERKWFEELGGMNVFFVFNNGELVTPPIGDTILEGITRASVITLAQDMGLKIVERRYAFEQMQADLAGGKLVEAFACGTAAAIAPISEVRSTQGNFIIGSGGVGPVAGKIRKTLLDIQYGRTTDPHGWVFPVNT